MRRKVYAINAAYRAGWRAAEDYYATGKGARRRTAMGRTMVTCPRHIPDWWSWVQGFNHYVSTL